VKQCLGAVFLCAAVAVACASAPPYATTASAQESELDERDAELLELPVESARAPTTRLRRRPLFVSTPIEDPSGRALSAFHNALRSAEASQGQARIVFYGASHVAADVYTDVIRTRLQTRFGEAGAGFALPAKPLPHYRNAGISIESSSGWEGVHVKASAPVSDHYGLAGMYVTTASDRRPARSSFSTRARAGLTGNASELELYYWKQPRGGRLKLTIDGQVYEVNTAAPIARAAYEHYALADGPHKVELQTRGDGPVKLFGMSLERDGPGVVLDTLGIPGARAAIHLMWNDELYREQLARRKPNLVVLAYGTNESGDDGQPIEEYTANLRRVVARVRDVVPNASCLLVGPSDRPLKNDGGYSERPRTALVVQTQRKVAAEYGCGFFDLVTFMGGPLGMIRWTREAPPLGAQDRVHFTHRGYEVLGDVLYSALLSGYQSSPNAAPLVFGPRPLAPPGSTLFELGASAQRAARGASEPATRSDAPAARSGRNRRALSAGRGTLRNP
jgi:lysophospholipase L1-like esterase